MFEEDEFSGIYDDDGNKIKMLRQYIYRMAVKHNKRRPDHLFLLRFYGAKTYQELQG